MHPLLIWMTSLGICKMSKTNMLIRPQKTCDTVLHPYVASVDLLCLETPHFRKCIYMQDCYNANKQTNSTYFVAITIMFQHKQTPSLCVLTKCVHFVRLHCNNCIIMHGMANAKFVICKMFCALM